MKKYGPLETHLKNIKKLHIPMSFSEIESIIGDRLPPSARKHRAWWSNNPSNSVITFSWLAAGYKTTSVNIEAETLVFEKAAEDPTPTQGNGESSDKHPLFGCMNGTVTIPDGVDLTKPADPDAAELAENPKLCNA